MSALSPTTTRELEHQALGELASRVVQGNVERVRDLDNMMAV